MNFSGKPQINRVIGSGFFLLIISLYSTVWAPNRLLQEDSHIIIYIEKL